MIQDLSKDEVKSIARDAGHCAGCQWGAGSACILTGDCQRSAVAAVPTALATQVAGNHYKDMAIQPVEFVHKNGIGYIEGSVIKYVSRWRKKNGVEDLRKARHFLDLLIEMEQAGSAS